MATPTIANQAPAAYLGLPSNPLEDVLRRNQSMALRQKFQQEQALKDKEDRDKAINETMAWSPEKGWEPFNKQILDQVDQYKTWSYDLYASGKDPKSGPELLLDKRKQDDINNTVRKSNFLKTVYNDARDVWHGEQQKYFDQTYYDRKLNDIFYDGKNARPIEEIDWRQTESILNDSAGYKINEIAADAMKDIAVKSFGEWFLDPTSSQYGEMKVSNAFQSKAFQHDPDTKNVFFDENTGIPKLNLIPEVKAVLLQNNLIKNYVNDKLSEKGNSKTQDQILKELIIPFDPLKSQEKVGGTNRKPADSKSGISLLKGMSGALSEDTEWNQMDDLGPDGRIGTRGKVYEIPGLVKNIEFPIETVNSEGEKQSTVYKMDVNGFKTDGKGNIYIAASYQPVTGMGSQVDSTEIPLTDANLTKIKNALKQAGKIETREQERRFDKEINTIKSDKGEVYYPDYQAIDNAVKLLINPENTVEDIKEILGKNGISASVKRDNSWALSWQNGFSVNDYIQIGNEKFYFGRMDSEKEIQRLAKHLVSQNPEAFATTEKPVGNSTPPTEENPW